MIDVKGLSKTFRIHKKAPGLLGSMRSLVWRDWQVKSALTNVSLKIESGEIVGLLGANGAGKTTLVKSLSGIIYPSQGQVKVMGFTPWERKNEFRRQIALLMGQKAQLWWDLPAADCYLLLREIYRIPQARFDANLDFLTEILDVKKLLTTQIRRLSLGERMKMELVAALLHDPKVVFLDEPTIGLDLGSQRALREFLLDYHRRCQPTMIVTSHYMEDIQRLCKRIVIIREGAIIYDGKLNDIIAKYALHKYITVQLAPEAEGLTELSKMKLSDISPALTAASGEILSVNPTEIKVKVLRALVPQIAAEILKKFPVVDLNVDEVDVGTIIDAIQKGVRH